MLEELTQVLVTQQSQKMCEIIADFMQKIDINGPMPMAARKRLRAMFENGTKDRLLWILRNNLREFALQLSNLLDSVVAGHVTVPEPASLHLYKSMAALKQARNPPDHIAEPVMEEIPDKLKMEKQIDAGPGFIDLDLSNLPMSASHLLRKPVLNFWNESFVGDRKVDWKAWTLLAAEETPSFHSLQMFQVANTFLVTCQDLAGPSRAVLLEVNFASRLASDHRVCFAGWTQASPQQISPAHHPEVLSRFLLPSCVLLYLSRPEFAQR